MMVVVEVKLGDGQIVFSLFDRSDDAFHWVMSFRDISSAIARLHVWYDRFTIEFHLGSQGHEFYSETVKPNLTNPEQKASKDLTAPNP